MHRKLYSIWWLVLLRGIVEGALVTPFLVPALQSREAVTLVVGLTALIGGLLELAMFFWMRGHIFQGILRLVGIAGVLMGGYLLLAPRVTMELLLVLTGLWLAIRGFAGLWLGLSIVQRPLDRAIPAGAGMFSLVFGAVAMLWLPADMEVFTLLIAAYALGSAVVHIALGLRMRIVGAVSPE